MTAPRDSVLECGAAAPLFRRLWCWLRARFTPRGHEAQWSDVLPSRQVEQEVLDIIDSSSDTNRR